MLNVTVLVSGGGTNLQAIMDAIDAGEIQNARITHVISNNPRAYALERAAKAGIQGEVLSPKSYDSRAEFNEAFLARLQEINPDLIVLAGFLVVIPEAVVKAFPYCRASAPSKGKSREGGWILSARNLRVSSIRFSRA